MGWSIEGEEAVLDWIGTEPDSRCHAAVYDWLPAFAEDPYAQPALRVTSTGVYVCFVPWTNVGVKYFLSDEFQVIRLFKLKTVTDL
jgi:hypothetical protein